MGTKKVSDQYNSTYWSIIRKVEIAPDQILHFFKDFKLRLQNFNWSKYDPELKIEENSNISNNSQDNLLDHVCPDLQEVTQIEYYIKKPWQYLAIGMHISNQGVQIAWDQRLNPKIGKILAIFTHLILLLASAFRLFLPIGNIIPLIIFILGTMSSIGIILTYMYKFEKLINYSDDVATAFLESVLKFEGDQLDHKCQSDFLKTPASNV